MTLGHLTFGLRRFSSDVRVASHFQRTMAQSPSPRQIHKTRERRSCRNVLIAMSAATHPIAIGHTRRRTIHPEWCAV